MSIHRTTLEGPDDDRVVVGWLGPRPCHRSGGLAENPATRFGHPGADDIIMSPRLGGLRHPGAPSMPAPVPLPIRQAMWRRRSRGATATELSQAFGIPARTVRGLLRRWRDRGESAVAPDYARRRPTPEAGDPAF